MIDLPTDLCEQMVPPGFGEQLARERANKASKRQAPNPFSLKPAHKPLPPFPGTAGDVTSGLVNTLGTAAVAGTQILKSGVGLMDERNGLAFR